MFEYDVGMFDDRLEVALGDRCALADLAAEVEQQQRLWGCRKLVIAAAWADANSEVDHPDGGLLVERLVKIGPAGTPAVAEFAPHGLVCPFGTTIQSAKGWMGDGLAIRHRLPRLWQRVVAGEIHHWKARQIAALTSELSVATVGQVDEQTSGWVGQLPWASFLKMLDATILQVDEQAYRRRERLAAAKREVRATQSEEGLRTLIARGEAGDVAMMLALYQRVAECLAEDGDEDPLPVRMSKAIGIIANPPRCNDLLAGTPTTPTRTRSRGSRSPPTKPMRPTRGPTICHPRVGRQPGPATTTSPASMRTTGGSSPAPTNPPAQRQRSGTGRSIHRSTRTISPGTSAKATSVMPLAPAIKSNPVITSSPTTLSIRRLVLSRLRLISSCSVIPVGLVRTDQMMITSRSVITGLPMITMTPTRMTPKTPSPNRRRAPTTRTAPPLSPQLPPSVRHQRAVAAVPVPV